MRKRYLKDEYGSDSCFWEANWDRDWEAKYKKPPSYPQIRPKLVERMERYLDRNMLILEGGCGDCHYVRYFSIKGYNIIGVDYAEKTIQKVKQALPELDIRYGDITHLDFPDGYFDAYYSGGVIEHFEKGPWQGIAEAHRVLKTGGYLFMSVPFMNVSRQFSTLLRKAYYKVDLDGRDTFIEEHVNDFCVRPPPDGYHFFEYVFELFEIRQHLTDHGFSIIEEMPYSSECGLIDLEGYRKLVRPAHKHRNYLNKLFAIPLLFISLIERSRYSLTNIPSGILGEFLGNMRLLVCRAVK
jgi:SAM-dependent methyltransferase